MLSLVVGIPGSGKTYYCVYKIYKYFVEPYEEKQKDEKNGFLSSLKDMFLKDNKYDINKYNVCYTNINGFKFELCNNLVKPFNFNHFYECMSILHSMYKNDKATDDELILKIKEFGYYKALIIIDEAHNYFDKKNDEILLWILTYHRHLFLDIDLITQNVSLISKDYSCLCEEFYKSSPPSLRISKNYFRYTQYLDNNFFLNRVVKRFSLPALQKIFNLYISGNDTRKKSLILKIFFIFVSFCIFSIFLFFIFLNGVNNNTSFVDNNQQINVNNSHNIKQNAPENVKSQDYYYYYVICYDNSYCKINNDEYKEISYKVFMYLKEINTPNFFEVNRSQKSITRFNLVYEKDIFKFLKKGLKNEKGVNSSMLPNF